MRAARPLLAAALLLGVAACSNAPAPTGATPYERGLSALAQGQPRTARIEFLNAIKADPGNGRLRLMQARTYLLLRDGAAAEAELRRARAVGIPDSELAHLMANALLLEGQPDRAIAEAAKAGPKHLVYAARMRARAAILLGDYRTAGDALDFAVERSPAQSPVWIDVARFRRASGALAGAIAAADRAVALSPNNVEALTLRGELTRSQYGLSAAVPWFDRALQIDSNDVTALIERAATLGDLGRHKAMLADVRRIFAIRPDEAHAWFFSAALAARAKKWDLARRLYGRTDGAMDGLPAAMLLAGAIDLETGASAQAAVRLGRLVAAQPDNSKARRLLAAAQWATGDSAGTIATLKSLADRPDADAYVLTLIGQAYAARGDGPSASDYLARAARPQSRSATALLGAPVDDATLDSLRRDAARSGGDAGAQVALIRALLARGQGGEALQRARQLEAANPEAPDAHVLAGDALGISGDYRGAADAYRRAANIAFTEPVAMRLVEALRNSGDAKHASEVLALFLDQNPQSVPAQMLAAGSYLQAGRWDEAIALYERLRLRLGNRDSTVLNNLAWAYSQKGDYDGAIPLARRAWQLDRNNPATADTLGWLLYKSGIDRAQGLALLEQAARGAPSDAEIRRHLKAALAG